MNHSFRFGVAIAGAVAGLTATALPATAAPAPARASSAVASSAVASAPPPGYHMVWDDTGLITVAIPDDWFVLSSPEEGPDGWIRPGLRAGPNPASDNGWQLAFAAPWLEVTAEPLYPYEVPTSPTCYSMQVVATPDDPFIQYVEYDQSRGIMAGAITEPGDNTSECDTVFEYAIANDAQAGVSYRIDYIAWGAGDPEPPAGQRVQDWEIFDVALASLQRPQLSFEHAVSDYRHNLGEWPESEPPIGLPEAFTDDGIWTLWPFPTFHDVPQFGDEPVRGSGCGANGAIGEIIPDGLWAGYLLPGPEDYTINIDLACVYFGQTAKDVVAGGGNVVAEHGPDFVVVNNNPRQRTLVDEGYALFYGVPDDDGNCTIQLVLENPAPGLADDLVYPDSLAWVRVYDGALVWAAYDCTTGVEIGD